MISVVTNRPMDLKTNEFDIEYICEQIIGDLHHWNDYQLYNIDDSGFTIAIDMDIEIATNILNNAEGFMSTFLTPKSNKVIPIILGFQKTSGIGLAIIEINNYQKLSL